MFHWNIQKYIEEKQLFTLHDKVLVALSGGADSVALLRVLLVLGYHCEAAHCNFHLRGEESDRDERFVNELCKGLGVTLHVTHFDTVTYASRHHVSIEMAAREMRYDWFEQLRKERGMAVIAVAHHRDDSVETFLLNLIRGAGINGLKGISPHNGCIVRPLLEVSRQDILDYLRCLRQGYVTDSTNLQDEYTRNKIRLNLLPMMQEINPSVKESIFNTAEHLSEVSIIYKKSIEEATKRVQTTEGICIDALMQETAPETLLFEILIRDIYRALEGQPGKTFSSEHWRVVKDRKYLLIEAYQQVEQPLLAMEKYSLTPDFIIPRDKEVACFDADKLLHPLSLRLWQQGDVFTPFGMKGRKKVSDYMTDRKFSLLRKEQQWVLCCGKDIIWLVGERTDNRFRVDSSTQRVLIIHIIKKKQ